MASEILSGYWISPVLYRSSFDVRAMLIYYSKPSLSDKYGSVAETVYVRVDVVYHGARRSCWLHQPSRTQPGAGRSITWKHLMSETPVDNAISTRTSFSGRIWRASIIHFWDGFEDTHERTPRLQDGRDRFRLNARPSWYRIYECGGDVSGQWCFVRFHLIVSRPCHGP